MIECGEKFRLPLKPGQPIRVGCDDGGQHFQSDRALQVGVGGRVDLAHTTHANLGGDFVRTEPSARSQGHEAGRGTLRRSSSTQFMTTLIAVGAGPFTIRKRFPYGSTSQPTVDTYPSKSCFGTPARKAGFAST